MTSIFTTSPDQVQLINDVIFDIIGLNVTLTDIGVVALAVFAVDFFVNSPMISRTTD